MNKDKQIPLSVLVIDDEPQILKLLKLILESKGYRVFLASTAKEGILETAQRRPNIIILDLLLPDMNGTEVIQRIREWSQVPILVLSAVDQEREKVQALDSGADDYLTKPFGEEELMARIRVLLRRLQPQADLQVFRTGGLEVDLVNRRVFFQKKEIRLTSTEYGILRLLVRHAGKVLTHRQILQEVWGPRGVDQVHYLRVYMARLREKIEENSLQPKLLLTEPGIGYRLMILDPDQNGIK
ncbi:response regulator [Candidatus Methylacidiphilum infernorum]|uniref:DNA-binding response regulator KdpE (REC-wHTH domains) n=1 Tax=Methylacidiphilum infernorum (isolate V4) TaxID=481448 RepID=B3E0R0_METI4|nr:response regulator [Candidatus Methylacidiphilum infernorum]ACD82814.1 DNA-binding response regulator KdpE (REC-wHTH domains) [Methylacidiphilum infernorum V4]